jgi:hypothetical protein
VPPPKLEVKGRDIFFIGKRKRGIFLNFDLNLAIWQNEKKDYQGLLGLCGHPPKKI